MKIKPKILLINPPSDKKIINKYRYELLPSLGLSYIAAVLEENFFEVEILDLWTHELSFDVIRKYIIDFDPDIVGITSDITRAKKTIKLTELVKSIDQNVLTVVGGPLPTVYPEFFNKSSIDLIVVGEGEYTFLEIVKSFPKKNYSKISGISYIKSGKQIFTRPRSILYNLDELPFPAWHLLPMKDYSFFSDKNVSSLITSRGCPFNCIFCNTSTIFGKMVRIHSPRYVVNMIKDLVKNYKVNKIIFKDSSLTHNTKNIEDICDLIIKEKIKIKWICNSRVDQVNLHLLEKMRQAGCVLIKYGAESGDPKILKRIKKNITVEQIENAVKLTKQAKINVSLYFMIGFPWDTKESITKTISLAKKLGYSPTTYFTFTLPLPGTELWDYCIRHNLIDKNNIVGEDPYFTPTIKLKDVSFEELIDLNKEAYKEIHRQNILKKLIKKFV